MIEDNLPVVRAVHGGQMYCEQTLQSDSRLGRGTLAQADSVYTIAAHGGRSEMLTTSMRKLVGAEQR